MSTQNKIKLVTHNSTFHADDIFATAVLSIYLEKKNQEFEIIRTRDPEIINSGDFVYDVGGKYDPEKNLFDHHQIGGAGKRENGIEYASFGLVWRHLGLELCNGNESVHKLLDQKIAMPIDAHDNGMDIVNPIYPGVFPYSAAATLLCFAPHWKEAESESFNNDIFKEQVQNVVRILKREIEVALVNEEAIKLMIEAYDNAKDKRIIELSENFPRYLYQDFFSKLAEPVYIVFPKHEYDAWKVEAVSKSPYSLESRKSLPVSWRGKMDPLKTFEIEGVNDVTFVHRSGFMLVTKTKEGAMKLAQIALESK